MSAAAARIDQLELQRLLARHLSIYRHKEPLYQARMLNSLLEVWKGPHDQLLDIGGGTGVIAQAMAEFFPVGAVCTVDVADRFCPHLSVRTEHYDGRTLPFANATFDAATLNNVVHHVPIQARTGLLREVRRVVCGPLYIKDHESRGSLDRLRLTALDAIGNIPFGGMLWARYLTRTEWLELADTAGYRITARAGGRYRRAPYALFFPNRLEVTMRWEPK